MKLRLPILAATLGMLAMLAVSPLTAAAANQAPRTGAASALTSLTAPVTTSLGAGTLSGTLSITHVANNGGQLVATGTITGTVTNTAGTVLRMLVSQPFTAPLDPTGTSCTILHLVIGPIFLDVLGLQITTNQIVVDITAVPGPGNLLGNLLCAVAHLLDNTNASLSAIAALLNNILAILQGL